MTTSLKKIAETILNRRNSLAAENVEADLRSKLTFTELKEAQARNWIIADPEFGTLAVSNLPRHRQEIQEAAESKAEVTPLQESGHKPSPGRALINELLESTQPVYTRMPNRAESLPTGETMVEELEKHREVRIREITSDIHSCSGEEEIQAYLKTLTPREKQWAKGIMAGKTAEAILKEDLNKEGHSVGDKVVVGQDGESFEGTVSEKLPSGEYKISFGEKKPKVEKMYKSDEIAKPEVKQGQPERSQTPAPQTIPAVAGI